MPSIYESDFPHTVSGITSAAVQALEDAGLHGDATEADSQMICAGDYWSARRIASSYVEVI